MSLETPRVCVTTRRACGNRTIAPRAAVQTESAEVGGRARPRDHSGRTRASSDCAGRSRRCSCEAVPSQAIAVTATQNTGALVAARSVRAARASSSPALTLLGHSQASSITPGASRKSGRPAPTAIASTHSTCLLARGVDAQRPGAVRHYGDGANTLRRMPRPPTSRDSRASSARRGGRPGRVRPAPSDRDRRRSNQPTASTLRTAPSGRRRRTGRRRRSRARSPPTAAT